MDWLTKMRQTFPDKMEKFQKGEDVTLKVWFGRMSYEQRRKRALSTDAIKAKQEELLAKGYRVVKRKGFSISSNAKRIFQETDLSEKDFLLFYDSIGRFENNFAPYFSNPGDFSTYADHSDIFILEDVKTGLPACVSTYLMIEKGDAKHDDLSKDWGGALDDHILWHDIFFSKSSVQGKGVGRLMMEILDGYYFTALSSDTGLGLIVGEINISDRGRVSKLFHTKRGFDDWQEKSFPMQRYMDRYQLILNLHQRLSNQNDDR